MSPHDRNRAVVVVAEAELPAVHAVPGGDGAERNARQIGRFAQAPAGLVAVDLISPLVVLGAVLAWCIAHTHIVAERNQKGTDSVLYTARREVFVAAVRTRPDLSGRALHPHLDRP
jgi:hypothetical protein